MKPQNKRSSTGRSGSVRASTPAPEARVLAIGAHPDDIEIGIGALISCLADQGAAVTLVDLTDGEPTPYGSRAKRKREAQAAASILGVSERICLGMPNRELFDSTKYRKALAAVIRRVRPTVIFTHYWSDVHPDHVAACSITEGARFVAKLSKYNVPGEPYFTPKILYYGSLHNRVRELPTVVVDTSAGMERKIRAGQAYRSQFTDNPKNHGVIDRMKLEGEFWGLQINSQFGEPLYSRDPFGVTVLSVTEVFTSKPTEQHGTRSPSRT